jgi:hypothetical protein
MFHDLITIQPLADFWVAFGMGKNYRFYQLKAICASLGDPEPRALPVFHAFPGCDTTSAFSGKGTKSIWQAWQAYKEVTNTFVYLARNPLQILSLDDDHFSQLERLTVVLYDKTSPWTSVNGARRELFCHRNCTMEKLIATDQRYTSAVCPTSSLPGRNLDKQHSKSAFDSFAA